MSIDQSLCPEYDDVENKGYIVMLLKYVSWFATNEIPTRGNDETAESSSWGNWLSFIKLQLDTNKEFLELHKQVTKKRMTDYTSKTSLNGFLQAIASCVRKEIYKEIEQVGVFSLLIDESKDTAKREELAIAVRYYFKNSVSERLIELNKLEEFDAPAITEKTSRPIKMVMQETGAVPISLGADGASAMGGEYAGVGKLLRYQDYLWLLFIHCSAHRLNLIVNDVIKNSKLAVDVIATITKLYTLLNHPKIRLRYEETYKLVYPKKQVQFLVQQHDIRWACKFEATDFVAEHPNIILSTLSHVSNTAGSKHAEEAAGFYHKLISGKFIVALVTARAYLAELNFLSKEIQAVDINWTDVEHCIRSTKAGIEEITTEKQKDVLIR